MSFQIVWLSPPSFAALFTMDDAERQSRRAVRMLADRKPGFPCRVSLSDAEVGEEVI